MTEGCSIGADLRICHVNFARGFRGGERQTLNLIEGLTRFGVDQMLICRRESELRRRSDAIGVKVTEVAHPLLGHLRRPQSDIIHVHEARGAYWAGIEHAIRNTPYIITRRVPNPISRSAVTASVYRKAAGLLGVSHDVSARLTDQTGRHVATILSSTTIHAANPESVTKIRQKLGGGPIIGHVGALYDHHKGQSVLIQAFHKLLADYPNARLLLVGEGPDRIHFQHLAKGDPRILFAGFQEDIGSWIAAMDIFGFPSREEGLGSSVMDAMALGVPIVASAAGGLPELIGRDERGMTVTNHDPENWYRSLIQTLSDDAMRARRVAAGRQFANENGISTMAECYLAIYAEIQKRFHRNNEEEEFKVAWVK